MNTYVFWESNDGKIVRTKRGWSWSAFFFGFFWALYKRMIFIAAISLILYFSFIFLLENIISNYFIDDSFYLYYSIINGSVFGLYGNKWIERKLKRDGYSVKKVRRIKFGEQNFLIKKVFVFFENGTSLIYQKYLVSGTIILGVVSSIIATIILEQGKFFDRFDNRSELDKVMDHIKEGPINTNVDASNSATLNAYVKANNQDIYIWFEWGETPDLGNISRKQLVKKDGFVYQEIIGLKPRTTYYYTIKGESVNGNFEGKVYSVTTASSSHQN